MRAATIETKLAELRADRESVPWPNRIRLVNGLLGDASRVRTLSPAASELLRLLAVDPKWEVRKEIADHLPKFGDSDFATFAAIFTEDSNAFVKAAAERALAGRRKGHLGSIKRAKGLDRMEDELQKVEIRHGTGFLARSRYGATALRGTGRGQRPRNAQRGHHHEAGHRATGADGTSR